LNNSVHVLQDITKKDKNVNHVIMLVRLVFNQTHVLLAYKTEKVTHVPAPTEVMITVLTIQTVTLVTFNVNLVKVKLITVKSVLETEFYHQLVFVM
jgi:hypothetical protein